MKDYRRNGIRALTIGLAVWAFGSSDAQAERFVADLLPLNNSGVSGRADLTLDGNLLTVRIQASGLVPDMPHPQHIHGRFSNGTSGTPIDSFSPTVVNDTDGDGFVEVAEGQAAYGPIILPLSSPPASDAASQMFPTAPGGMIDFTETYDLSDDSLFFDPVNMLDFQGSDLLPLDLREIVLHGLTLADGQGSGPGEADGTGGYKPTLPVASGVIRAVPEPATLGMLGVGVLGLLAYGSRRRSARGEDARLDLDRAP